MRCFSPQLLIALVASALLCLFGSYFSPFARTASRTLPSQALAMLFLSPNRPSPFASAPIGSCLFALCCCAANIKHELGPCVDICHNGVNWTCLKMSIHSLKLQLN